MRRWRWMVAFVVLASACAGGDSGGDTASTGVSDGASSAVSSEDTDATAASPEGMVKSADGLATLSLPAGSLPEGVSPEDIHIEARFSDSDDPAMPIVAVQLLPSGLVLGEAASLTIALPEAPDGGLMAILSSDDSIEFLDGEIEEIDGMFSFTTPVEHFSWMMIFKGELFFETTLQVDFPTVSVGDTQTATATIILERGEVDLLIPFDSDDPGTARLVTVAAQAPIVFLIDIILWQDATYAGDGDTYRWDSPEIDVGVAETFDGWETTPATSQCTKENDLDPRFNPRVGFDLRLVNLVGPAQDEALFVFGQLGGSSRTPGAALARDGLDLMSMAKDDTFGASAMLLAETPSTCTEGEDSATATETPDGKTPDALGDAKAGSDEEVEGLGVDILLAYFDRLESGEICFIIDVNGNGEEVARLAGTYLIIVEWLDLDSEAGGYGARVQSRSGEWEPGSVQIGPLGSGRDKLEGATVTGAWDDSDTVRTCVDGGEMSLGVDTFDISTNVFGTTDGNVFDYASGGVGP